MILVTGGGGFLGSHLVQALLDNGEDVRVLERPGANIDHLPLRQLDIITTDIRDGDGVRRAVSGCKQIYHLAADPNLWRRNTHEFDAINHQGTVNVLEAGLEQGARILHCSTESILTSRQFHGGAVEDLVLQEADMMGPYCLSKFHAEQAAFRLAAEGAPVIVVSPTLPMGPGDRLLTPPARMNLAFCQGRLPALLDCRVNIVDARDVAIGMVAAMAGGTPGVRYLLGNKNCWLSEWLALLAAETGQQVPKARIPYPVALTYAWLSESWARYVNGKMPMATVTGVRLTRRSMHFDPAASLSALDLHPRSLATTAHDTVDWYRQQGWLELRH